MFIALAKRYSPSSVGAASGGCRSYGAWRNIRPQSINIPPLLGLRTRSATKIKDRESAKIWVMTRRPPGRGDGAACDLLRQRRDPRQSAAQDADDLRRQFAPGDYTITNQTVYVQMGKITLAQIRSGAERRPATAGCAHLATKSAE